MKLLLAFFFSISAFANGPVVTIEYDVKSTLNSTDILFIIDNSGSMGPHQKTLMKLSEVFLKELKEAKFQISAISTDEDDKIDSKVITPGTPNGIEELKKLINNFGTNGSANEIIFKRLIDFNKSELSEKLLRKGNPLEVIILTDEEEQSTNEYGISYRDVIQEYNLSSKKIHVNSIVPTDSSSRCASRYFDIAAFKEIAAKTGGNVLNLCSAPEVFSSNYSELAKKIKQRANQNNELYIPISHHKLTGNVDFESISINYGSQVIPKGHANLGWIYNSIDNSIYFGKDIELDANQPKGTKLVITYMLQE